MNLQVLTPPAKPCHMVRIILMLPTILLSDVYLDFSWHLDTDGWIHFPNVKQGIVWIPEQYRFNLVAEETPVIISRKGYNRMSLKNCVYGEDWHKCWDYNPITI